MPTGSQRRRGVRTWQVAGAVLALAVGGLLAYAFWTTLTGEDAEGERELGEEVARARTVVEVVVVVPSDFPLRSESIGHLAPWRSAEISAEAGGIVLERPVEEGHRVAKGALLLAVDSRDERIVVQEAEAAVLKARADYAVNLRMDGAQAEGDTTLLFAARNELRQAEAAFDAGNLTQTELKDVRRRFEATEVLSGKQRNAVQAVTSGLTQAEQQLERALLDLRRTRIFAPFTGRVADLEVEIGQQVAIGKKVLTLLEDDRMKVAVNVLEADIVRMRVGSSAHVRVPVLDDGVFAGRIYSVNPSVDTKTGAGRVTVSLPNPRGRLIAGLHADVALETERLEERLVVPSDAWLQRQGRDLVFRVLDGQALWTYVTTGRRSGDNVEIIDGLSAGDTVAVVGHHTLAHDTPVVVSVVREPDLR